MVETPAAVRTGRWLHPERQHVGHREPAGVAQQLGDQQQRHQPGDQEADRVQEAVVAGQRDAARRCRGTTRRTCSRRRSRGRSASRRRSGRRRRSRRRSWCCRLAQKVMPRVMATKARNSRIVRAALLDRASARRVPAASALLRPRSRRAACRRRGSSSAVGVARVQAQAMQERGHELQQPEDQRDVDVAEELGGHEVARPGRQHDVEQVPGQERDRHRERRSRGIGVAVPGTPLLPEPFGRRCAAGLVDGHDALLFSDAGHAQPYGTSGPGPGTARGCDQLPYVAGLRDRR